MPYEQGLFNAFRVSMPTVSPRIQIKCGSVVGPTAIKNAIAMAGPAFINDIRQRGDTHIMTYFPEKTGNMKSTIIANRTVTKNAVRYSAEKVIELRQNPGRWVVHRAVRMTQDKRYAKFVEYMTGVNWTNPLTIEHPMTTLKRYMKTIIKSSYNDVARIYGLRVVP